MLARKILAVVNGLLGFAALVVLVAGYWYLWRPVPQTSGSIASPLAKSAAIRRDALGVPHIEAATVEDAYFAQGYVTAQDRFWQMDMLRRRAAGELAEVIGKAAVESDTMSRKLRLRRIAQQQADSLNPAERALLAAYARGVNSWLESHRERMPPEYALLRYDPRPWRISDTLLAGLEMFRTLSGSWEDELLKKRMLAAGDPAKVEVMFPTWNPREVSVGSNAWAVSGKLTASGKPLLASDPHLQWTLPSVWYLVHLKTPELNVAGVSLPGVPAVIIGHNDHIAWGVTNLHFDVQDLYMERIDARTGQYNSLGMVLQARREVEVIAVKGQRPVEVVNWITGHGPLFTADQGQPMSLRWTAAEPRPFEFPFLELNQAKDFAGFRKALSRYSGPAQNFVYADVQGNIGYQATGRLPIRKGFSGDVPLDGVSGKYEWSGFIPFEELPSIYNPPSGMIVTANQNPFPKDYAYPVSGSFTSPYRARQITDRLQSRTGWKPEEFLALQKDVYSPFSHFLARQVVAAADNRQVTAQQMVAAVRLLKEWNGQMEKGTPQPFMITLAYRHIRRAIAERAAPKAGGDYATQMSSTVVETLLRERPRDWFLDWDKALLDSFTDALEEGIRMQGRNLAKWDYGRYNELTISHPVARLVPWIGQYFSVGPFPMSGSFSTVKQTSRTVGPSMRMVADTANWDQTLQNITLGQSGHLFSGHYKDQWDAYYSGKSFPFPYRNVPAGNTLTLAPE